MTTRSVNIRRQDGQAFMLGLFVVLAAFLLVGLIYNTGVLLSHKMALQNAADVGAMTGAMVQAHGLTRIIQKEKKIRNIYIEHQNNAAGHFAEPEAVSKAFALTQMNQARARIEQEMNDIVGGGGLNHMYSGWSRNMVDMIVKRNYKFLDGDPEVIVPSGLENKITNFQARDRIPFYYYYLDECTIFDIPCFKYNDLPGRLDVWHRGKSGLTVMAVRVKSETIPSDQLFAGGLIAPDGIPPMEAISAAKPFGGFIVHDHARSIQDPVSHVVPMPWTIPFVDDVPGFGNLVAAHAAIVGTSLISWQWPPDIEVAGWNETVLGFPWNRHDYEAFLVSIGHPRVAGELGYAIEDADEYLH